MIEAAELKRYLDFAYAAYQEHNVSNQAYRQDGKVPYVMHPLWCASMLIADTEIPWEERELGFKAFILHDVLEDTDLPMPEWVELKVQEVVRELTFESFEAAEKLIPQKTPFIKLLLLFDSLSSMYENHVKEFHRSEWKQAVLYLLKEAENNYGDIRIVQVGKVIADNTDW